MHLDTRETKTSTAERSFDVVKEETRWIETFLAQLPLHRMDSVESEVQGLAHYPQRLTQGAYYCLAYPLMFLSRRFEERMEELFQKGYAKGTVASGIGNEATAVGMTL